MENLGRPYNALTGKELKTVIVKELERALDRAGINSVGVTYPMASWSWTLHLKQIDPQTGQTADTPERDIETGQTEAEALAAASADEEIMKARKEAATGLEGLTEAELEALTKPSEPPLTRVLKGGSKRFRNSPPSPTEVREAEQLPIPEA
jgi:hypothetical protein